MSKMPTPEEIQSDSPRLNIRKRKSMVARAALQLLGRPGAIIGFAWVVIVALLAVIAPLIASSHPIAWKVDGKWSSPMIAHFTPVDIILMFGTLALLVLIPLKMVAFKSRVWAWLLCSLALIPLAVWQVAINWHQELALVKADDIKFLDLFSKYFSDLFRLVFAGLFFMGLLAMIGLSVRALVMRREAILLGVCGLVVLVMAVTFVVNPVSPPDMVVLSQYREAIASGEIEGKKVESVYFTLIPYSPNDRLRDSAIKADLTPPGARPSEEDIAIEMLSMAEARYGVRSYTLKEPDGSLTPIPRTIDEARSVSDRLWEAHQQLETYRPGYGRQINRRVNKKLDELAAIEIGERYHLMGTTVNGEDLASRMIHACRIALSIGLISTSIAVFLGIIFGGLLGYFAGWADLIGLRLVEIFASIPVIMLLIMIVAFYGRNLYLMMVVLGLTGWVGYAYFIRAEFLKLRKMDYVMAARATGAPLHKILFQHMLPNGVAPVLVAASFGIAGAIRTEATLSFIGLGLEEEPSWGQMLDQARRGGAFSWWLATYPGLAIFLTIFAYNLIGEALRDVIDPRAVK